MSTFFPSVETVRTALRACRPADLKALSVQAGAPDYWAVAFLRGGRGTSRPTYETMTYLVNWLETERGVKFNADGSCTASFKSDDGLTDVMFSLPPSVAA